MSTCFIYFVMFRRCRITFLNTILFEGERGFYCTARECVVPPSSVSAVNLVRRTVQETQAALWRK
jgi:hypothetical protein